MNRSKLLQAEADFLVQYPEGFDDVGIAHIKKKHNVDKLALSQAYEKRLYGRSKKRGFEELVGMPQPFGLAKWSVVSVVPFYLFPNKEAFVKPTTAKGIIANLEVEELQYKPGPTWEFYQGYQHLLREIREAVVPSLSPNNAALTGFLMISL